MSESIGFRYGFEICHIPTCSSSDWRQLSLRSFLCDWSPTLWVLHILTVLGLHATVKSICSESSSSSSTKCVSPQMHEGWLQRTRLHDTSSIEEIFTMSDDQLFSKINNNSQHILQQLMSDRPSLNYSLRARPHNKTLIAKTTQLNDQDFIIRSIYKDSYWLHFKHIQHGSMLALYVLVLCECFFISNRVESNSWAIIWNFELNRIVIVGLKSHQ